MGNSATVFLGIDPGIKGAIAFYRSTDKKLHVFDMPTKKKKKTDRNEVDEEALVKLLRKYAKHVRVALVEEVGAMTYRDASGQVRGQGASASFAFGKSFGVILGVLAALEVPTLTVYPAIWKGLLLLDRDKTKSRMKAIETFPQNAHEFKRVKDDGRAEAALLALFASSRF